MRKKESRADQENCSFPANAGCCGGRGVRLLLPGKRRGRWQTSRVLGFYSGLCHSPRRGTGSRAVPTASAEGLAELGCRTPRLCCVCGVRPPKEQRGSKAKPQTALLGPAFRPLLQLTSPLFPPAAVAWARLRPQSRHRQQLRFLRRFPLSLRGCMGTVHAQLCVMPWL